MSDASLAETITRLVSRIPSMRTVRPPLTEADTCGGLVEPVLNALGWDTSDVLSVRRQYRHGTGDNPVDYGLLVDGTPMLFVEAKSLTGDLDDARWRNQTLAYAYHAGVEWCALTNGAEWRLFKTMAPGDASARLFRRIPLAAADAPEVLSLISPPALKQGAAARLWDAEYAERLVRPAYEAVLASREFAAMVRKQLAEPLPLEAVAKALQRIGLAPVAPPPSPSAKPLPAGEPTPPRSPRQASTKRSGNTPRLPNETSPKPRREKVADLLANGRLRPGQTLRIRGRSNSDALIVDAKKVRFRGEELSWNDWGQRVTGWPSINIYAHAETLEGRLINDFRAGG